MIVCGVVPDALLGPMRAAAVPMLTSSSPTPALVPHPERE